MDDGDVGVEVGEVEDVYGADVIGGHGRTGGPC
jgi:hypothetical protein